MFNPITKKRTYLFAYFLFWILVAALQAVLVHWTQEVPWLESSVEAAIYATLFGFAGLSIWFVVRFTGLQFRNLWNALINHFAAASLLISAWLSISYTLSSLILGRPMDIRDAPAADLSWRIGLGVVYYILVSLNYYLLIFYQNFREKEVSELEMKSLLKESELSMLKAQLNPHFIFNSLNSISALTLTRPEDAHEMIVKLSTFLRHTIGHSERDLISIHKELETISLYLAIEKSRFGDKLIVDVKGLEDIKETTMLPNLILQPLVENAVKYGVYEMLEESKISIDLAMDNNYLVVRITNTTGEIPKGIKGKGIGLKNVHRRLQYIYESGDLIRTKKEANLFITTLKIPQNLTHEKAENTDH